MKTWSRACGVGVMAFLIGRWLGEDISKLLIGWDGIALLLGLLIIAGFLGSNWLRRFGLILLVLGIAAVGFVSGRHEAGKAFNECVARGEEVRSALAKYRQEHGNYPDNLNDLNLHSRPGRRLFRGDFLKYQRTGDGYNIGFGDWLVTHSGSDREPFNANK